MWVQCKDQAGFSLIEVSLLLLIAGLFITPLAVLYNNQIEQRRLGTNLGNFTEISSSMNYFVGRDARYPVPASLFAGPGDADFGTEFAGVIDNCTAWPGTSGICRTGGANSILIGAVPFNALGLNDSFTHDYWGNKILYAVTEAQTVAYAAGAGAVATLGYDVDGTTIVNQSTSSDMILLTHGMDMRGAYNREGNLVLPCAAVGFTAVQEENCDMDGTFFVRVSQAAVGSRSLVTGANYFDDIEFVQESVPVSDWFQNITDSDYALTFAPRIGVGTEDPQAKIHVVGDVQADTLFSDSFCDGPGADCFNPEMIDGAMPEMNCDDPTDDQAVISLRQNRVFCSSPVNTLGNPVDGDAYVFPVSFTRVVCANSSKMMRGIDANGDPICVDP